MKRRFRSFDYTEELYDGRLYVMHLRIRDYVDNATYYAEYVTWNTLTNGIFFYDKDEEPIDDPTVVCDALLTYTQRAFQWRMDKIQRTANAIT